MPLCTALSSLNLATNVLACAVISAPPQVTTAVSPTAASSGGRIIDSTVGREPKRIVVAGRSFDVYAFSWVSGAIMGFWSFSAYVLFMLTDLEVSVEAPSVTSGRLVWELDCGGELSESLSDSVDWVTWMVMCSCMEAEWAAAAMARSSSSYQVV